MLVLGSGLVFASIFMVRSCSAQITPFSWSSTKVNLGDLHQWWTSPNHILRLYLQLLFPWKVVFFIKLDGNKIWKRLCDKLRRGGTVRGLWWWFLQCHGSTLSSDTIKGIKVTCRDEEEMRERERERIVRVRVRVCCWWLLTWWLQEVLYSIYKVSYITCHASYKLN